MKVKITLLSILIIISLVAGAAVISGQDAVTSPTKVALHQISLDSGSTVLSNQPLNEQKVGMSRTAILSLLATGLISLVIFRRNN